MYSGLGMEVIGDGVLGDDTKIFSGTQGSSLGPYEVLGEVLQTCGRANLFDGKFYDKTHIAVGDAHV